MVALATHSGKRYEYSAYGKRFVYARAGNGTNDPLCLTARGIAPRVLDGPFVDDGTGLVQPYSINPFGHQGLYHDEHLGPDAIQNRARDRRSTGFLQRDPHPGTHYPDGMNTYAPHHVMHQGLDPSGSRSLFQNFIEVFVRRGVRKAIPAIRFTIGSDWLWGETYSFSDYHDEL